ncbi:MAG: glycosyltransferase family 4 protein [Acidimicrobiia bacterium]|nr:glycosyltransferase family 4 protein [Acidimicrobiia bacterium]MDH5238903.1 glycosyltransferase family 4 protein [Acidimicrobiia bacterium]
MRVGMVCPYSLTLPGGVQSQVLALARTMREMGVHVRVLGPCDGPPPDAGVTPLGNSLPAAANGSIAPVAPDPPAQLRLIRALRDEAFDVLHVHEPLSPGASMTSLVVRSAPIVGTFHAAGARMAYEVIPGCRWLRGRIDRAFAVSEDARAVAAAALGGEYTVVFNGVEVGRFATAPPHPTLGPTIFFIGRHEPRKGLGVLLAAMGQLRPDARLWIAGEGPQTVSLQAQTAGDPRIEWLGRIDEADKRARMRGADVFCAPSLGGESFGIVLLEAMAAGTPIVASELPGYARVVGDAAELVAPDDARSLAAAIGRALEPARAEALVAAGRHRAEQFSMKRLAELYLEAYEGLLTARDQ